MRPRATPAAPLRVLVVDDTPDLRDLLRMALERTGEFRVVAEAENGRDAIGVVGRACPDLVLLDYAMPVMDGLEALPQIRQRCPTATVIMLSGFGASELTGRALASGADGYVQKGQSLGAMVSQVRTHVAQADARRRGTSNRVPPSPRSPGDAEDHLEQAPFGFLQVRDGLVVRANREAGRLLGDLAGRQVPLVDVAPALAAHLDVHRHDDSTLLIDLGEPARQITAIVRAGADSQLVYLQSRSGDEAELLRRAIATAAHEIRTPVSVLMGVSETLEVHGHELTDDERRRMLAAIGRQTRMLDNMTADLLAAGQAQHGTLAVQLEEVDATEIVRTVIGEGCDLVLVDDLHPLVMTDPMRLQQMLGNLVSNARKYGEPPFAVRVRHEGADVRFEVEDAGAGVPEEFRPRLFQEYSRAAGTSARGTGLGLFVVRALAEAQGGAVTYAPLAPHGSVFTLRLPSARS